MSRHVRPRLGGAIHSTLPRLLSRTLGPVLRGGAAVDRAFLDRLDRTHAQAILAMSDQHWTGLIRSLGLTDCRAVLDLGCGAGAWLPALGKLNGRVVGVDIDDRALEIARTRAAEADNVEVRQMPAEALEFDAGSFDAVTCLSVLPYLDHAAAMRRIARVLSPNGRLVLGTVGSGYYAKHVVEGIRHDRLDVIRYGLDPILVAGGRAIAGDRIAPESVRSWSPRAVQKLLRKHGFAVDAVVCDVTAVDPSWPTRFFGRPVYFITVASNLAAGGAIGRPAVSGVGEALG